MLWQWKFGEIYFSGAVRLFKGKADGGDFE